MTTEWPIDGDARKSVDALVEVRATFGRSSNPAAEALCRKIVATFDQLIDLAREAQAIANRYHPALGDRLRDATAACDAIENENHPEQEDMHP